MGEMLSDEQLILLDFLFLLEKLKGYSNRRITGSLQVRVLPPACTLSKLP